MRDIYFKFGVPFLMALCLTLFKKLAESELPCLDDANDTALDLIMVSIGAMAAFHAGGWTADQYSSAIVLNVFFAGILLTVRGARARNNAKLTSQGAAVPSVGFVAGATELLLGFAALIATVTNVSA